MLLSKELRVVGRRSKKKLKKKPGHHPGIKKKGEKGARARK